MRFLVPLTLMLLTMVGENVCVALRIAVHPGRGRPPGTMPVLPPWKALRMSTESCVKRSMSCVFEEAM